ncbi:MAG: helicase HerA domain-containing protein [Chloroflexota bacterium]
MARRILPPPRNEVDAEAVEQLLGSLHGASGSLSLEIAGSPRQRQLLVRGAPPIVNTVVHQLQGAYGQVSWQDPGDDDPALCFSSSAPEKGVSVAHCCLGLRRPVFFPLKTWREFEAADPLQVLLGAFRGLQNQEQLLSQLVLVEPAPDDWADAYQGSLQTIDYRTQATTPAGQARAGLFAVGILLATMDLVALFLCAGTLARPAASAARLLKALGGVVTLAVLNLGLGKLGWRWWRELRTRLNANPEVVQRKARLPAFRCALRLWAAADSPDRAAELMQRLTSAYRLYNLAEGNALIVERGKGEKQSPGRADHWLTTRPAVVPANSTLPRLSRMLCGLRRALAGETGLILNLAELAGLWHIPVGDAPELVRREEHDRFVPLPEDVEDPDGVHIGCSIKDDQTTVRVSLSRDALRRNSLLMGKTQMGKSNLMEILARRAMRDQDGALVVLDPQGDMARALRGMVPPDRIGEAYYLDFADRERVVSLNLLDMTLGVEVDKVVSDLIGLGEAIWSRFWGPRMEATWRYAAKTLALINQDLVAEGFADEQYTLLDIPALLLAPEKRRRHFVSRNLSWESPEGRDAHWWWNTYYEELRSSLQQDVISPVLTKVFRVAGNNVSRMAFGQPRSTLDVRRVLGEGGILLVHTAHGELGEEIGGFIGAVFLNMLNVVIRERSQAKRAGRRPCMVIIDEFQSIPSVDYAALLSELQKFEVSFVLGTQSLARLRSIGQELPGVSFAGVTTVLSFQTNFEDAEYLSGELDGVEPSNLVDLEPFEAYVKTTGKDGERLPLYSVRTRKAAAPDPEVAARVLDRVSGFTLPAVDAEKRPGKLATELGGGSESSERVEQLEANLHRAGGESLFSKELLTKLARMTATKSAQAFQGAAGNVGRGLPTRTEKPGSARSSQTPGFRALDAERER